MKEGLAGDWIGQAPIWWWSLQTMRNIHEEIKYAHVCLPTHVWNQDEIVPHKWSPPVSVGWFYRTTEKMGYVVICHLAYYSYLNKQTVCAD